MADLNKCIYCGSKENLSRDHVPPKCLFPSPAPSNLITVPSCEQCNKSFSMDEEYFRVIITSLSGTEQHPDAKKLFETKIVRGLERRPKLASKVMSTVVPIDLYSGDKKIVTAPAYDVNKPEFNRVIVKILRGLLFYETGLIPTTEYVVKWNVLDKPLPLPPKLFEALKSCPVNSFGNGVFRYQVYITPRGPGSFWMLSFYDGAWFHGGIFIDQSAILLG